MTLVQTKIGKSDIHAIGLFADQFIPKGTMTWKYNPKFDGSLTEADIAELSEPARKQVMHYAYYLPETKQYIMCNDDQRFINHSQDPSRVNITSTPDYDIAARDIQPGEELLCNYFLFDATYFARLGIPEHKLV